MIRNILHNVSNITVQNSAKHIDRMGTDAFVALEPGNLSGADVVALDEGVLRNALLFHYVPEIVIGNHFKFAPLYT